MSKLLIKNRNALSHFFKHGLLACMAFTLALCVPQLALADFVGEAQTTKFLDKATQDMIAARYQAGGGGLAVGDEISYIIQFTPVPSILGTEQVGGGAYVTDYIPAGTQVVGAQFVQDNGNGTFTQVAPPPVAQVLGILVPQYSETGIFYSTDPRTAMYTNNASPAITPLNGYAGPTGGPTTAGATSGATAANMNYSIHNAWDASIFTPYVANPGGTAACLAANAVVSGVPSPVAGLDTLIKGNVATGQGPWRRISYPGSTYGTMGGVIGPNGGCIGGTPTSAGWLVSSANPLPANTNAVRFAGGQTTVGQLFSVRITLKITQAIGVNGIINNSEVFGGDVSVLNTGLFASKSNIWRYVFPSVANASTNLIVVKRIVGTCVGVGCVIQPYQGSSLPSVANLNVRYEVSYLNGSGGAQSNVTLVDTMPTGAALVVASPTIISGANILPIVVGVAPTFSFQPQATLGSGAGGAVQYTLSWAAAPPAGVALSNTIKMTSTSVPAGATSTATATPTTLASLTISKNTTTATTTPGGVASYVINVPNTGAASATSISVTDTLPSSGASAALADRFSYLVNSVIATITNALGVATPVTPITVLVTAPTLTPFREAVKFTLPASTVIPPGGSLKLTFGAAVGSNVPATNTPYLNDASASYRGGATVATASTVTMTNGVAPVTVTVPLAITKSIDCVYVGAVCTPYSNGASIPTGSKVKYRLTYANTGTAAIANVTLTDTLPVNTTFVAATAAEVGTPYGIIQPSATVAVAPARSVLTFLPIASLPGGATGAVTFDVQLGLAALIPSGSYITNDAVIKSTVYPGGTTSSLTTSVLDQANLVVTKTTTTPTIPVSGVASYTIHVVNTGNVAASGIRVYDSLPFVGSAVAPTTRFNYTATAAFVPPAAPSTLTAPVATSAVGIATNAPPLSKNPNQNQVLWTFTAAQVLAPGAAFDLTFTATAGTGLLAGSSIYLNDVQAMYTSSGATLSAGVSQTAPVTIPSNLTITKSIDCVYNSALTACNAYNGTGIIPVNAKVRYKILYANTAATAQTNVYICDQITSNQAAPAMSAVIATPTIAPTPNGPFANLPALAAPATPANAACAFPALVAPTTGVAFSFPVIASLAANSSGVVYYDITTNAATGASIANTGKLVSTQAPGGEKSVVTTTALNAPSLSITKSTTTPVLTANGTATYTVSITNTGSGPTTSLKIYDFLPYSGTALDSTKRFSYVATTAYTKATTAAPTPVAFVPTTPIITSSVPPTVAPYNANVNQQQVLWDFGAIAANQLAAGDTLTITFTTTAGSAMPSASYNNSVGYEFASAAGPGSNNVNGLATVTVAPPLLVTKKIIAVCTGLGCTPTAYTAGTMIPQNALIRYQIDYSNPSSSTPQTNVMLTDLLPVQTLAAPVSNVVILTGAITAPTPATLVALGAGGATLTFPTLASLPALATGSIQLDVQTNAPAAATVNNTAKIVTAENATGSTSIASANTHDLVVTKTIDCVFTNATTCTPYVAGALIPVNAKLRYKIAYSNASATVTHSNVVLSDILPTAVTAAGNLYVGLGVNVRPSAPVLTENTALAGAARAPDNLTLTNIAGGSTVNFAVIPSLAPAANGWLTIDVQTNTSAAMTVSNTAAMTSTQDTIGVTGVVKASTPNLVVNKTIIGVCAGVACTPTPYTAGSVIPVNAKLRYQITYSNASATAAQTNVVISDTLPVQTTAVNNVVLISGTVPPNTTLTPPAPTGGTFSFTAIPSLAAGQTGTIQYDVQTNAAAGVTVSNSATAKSTEDTTGVTSVITTEVTNIVLSKVTTTAKALQGGLATYTITVQNASAVPVDNILVYDFLPFTGAVADINTRFSLLVGSSTFTGGLPVTTPTVSVAPTLAPYSSNVNQQQVLWNFGAFSLPANSTATITFSATPGTTIPYGIYGNSALISYKVAGVAKSIGIDGVANVEIAVKPNINLSKVVKAYSDPVNGTNNPKFLPGGVAEYSVTASNNGGSADLVSVEDFVPINTTMYVADIAGVGAGPISFVPSTSGLTYSFLGLSSAADSVEFLNGATVVTPVPGADGCDPAITKIRVKPSGIFAGSSTAPIPSFTLNFRVCLQ